MAGRRTFGFFNLSFDCSSAWLVYRYLGVKFVSRSWFNLDATWAVSLILVDALSLAISLARGH
jgi:hypothetical protein